MAELTFMTTPSKHLCPQAQTKIPLPTVQYIHMLGCQKSKMRITHIRYKQSPSENKTVGEQRAENDRCKRYIRQVVRATDY